MAQIWTREAEVDAGMVETAATSDHALVYIPNKGDY